MYETPDVPEEHAPDYYDDAESEYIERLHLSSDDSSNKFKGKYLTGNIDFSQHDVRGCCWELAAHGEKESPLEKYRRLKCEMDELLNEIVDLNVNATNSKRDKESYEAVSSAVNSAQKVLGNLKLENVLGTETVSSASDNEIKKLIAQVEGFKSGRSNGSQTIETSRNQLEHTKRIAELEARLNRIEKIVGTQQQDKLCRLSNAFDTNATLLDSVQQISTKAALLQPAQLDQIEQRISVLTTKLNGISEKLPILNGKNETCDDKINDLYDIAKKIEPVAKLLPNMLHRMQTLKQLHNHGEFNFFIYIYYKYFIISKLLYYL